MSNSADSEQYTGLILLSGVDKPGITASLFEVLSAFAITILDIDCPNRFESSPRASYRC